MPMKTFVLNKIAALEHFAWIRKGNLDLHLAALAHKYSSSKLSFN